MSSSTPRPQRSPRRVPSTGSSSRSFDNDQSFLSHGPSRRDSGPDDEEMDVGRDQRQPSRSSKRQWIERSPAKPTYAPVSGGGEVSDSDSGAEKLPPETAGYATPVTTTPPPTYYAPPPKRRIWPWLVGGVLCVILVGFAVFAVVKTLQHKNSTYAATSTAAMDNSTTLANGSLTSATAPNLSGDLTPSIILTTGSQSPTEMNSNPSSGSRGSSFTPGSQTLVSSPWISSSWGSNSRSAVGSPTPTTSATASTPSDILSEFIKVEAETTWFEATNTVTPCGTIPTDDDFVVHISSILWGSTSQTVNSLCGRWISVWNPVTNFTRWGTIQGFCSNCTKYQLDLSKAMFAGVNVHLNLGTADNYWWATVPFQNGSYPAVDTLSTIDSYKTAG